MRGDSECAIGCPNTANWSRAGTAVSARLAQPLRDIEREALELTLQLTDYNQSAAARILCISRPTLARKLKAYGLAKEASH